MLGLADFPYIVLDFAPGLTPGYYGGLRPDGAIQICTRNLTRAKVEGSEFAGDLSFVELVMHEATHKLQSYMAARSGEGAPVECLNMKVAEAFYEATEALRKLNRDIYTQHPFETQARSLANFVCSNIGERLKSQEL